MSHREHPCVEIGPSSLWWRVQTDRKRRSLVVRDESNIIGMGSMCASCIRRMSRSLHVYKIQVGKAPTEQQFAIGVVFGGPCRATFPGCIFYKPFSCCNLDVILRSPFYLIYCLSQTYLKYCSPYFKSEWLFYSKPAYFFQLYRHENQIIDWRYHRGGQKQQLSKNRKYSG